MMKLKKRLLRPFCALLLCLTLSGGAAFTSYASVPSIFFSAPEAFAALMAMLGVTSNSSDTYSAGDALAAWGSDQIDDMVSYISTSQKYAATLGKLGVDALKENVVSWATKAGQGVIDTASNIWGAFRDWVGSLYTNIGSTGGVSYGGRAVALEFEKQYYLYFGSNTRGAYFYTDSGGVSNIAGLRVQYESDAGSKCSNIFYIQSSLSSVYVRFQYGSYIYDSRKITLSPMEQVNDVYYYIFGIDYSSDYSYSADYDVPFIVWSQVSTEKFSAKRLLDYIRDGLTGFPASSYNSIGGVGDVFKRDSSLDNIGITGVGVGARVGDVPIDWAGFGDLAETLEGLRTGVLDIAGVMADSKVWAYDTTRDTVIDSDGDLDNDIPIADVIPGMDVADYTIMGLQNVFPFCIPFDLIDFLNVLDATPEAPRFQWEFEYMSGKTYTIDIDLSRFETVASMFRTFQLLAFCLALIMITRDKMIKG